MDLAPDPDERGCECPADARIARHFDAKASERSDDGWETGLIAVSQRLSDALMSLDPTGKTVLEPGCGRGGLLLGLVQAGGLSLPAGSPSDPRSPSQALAPLAGHRHARWLPDDPSVDRRARKDSLPLRRDWGACVVGARRRPQVEPAPVDS
jgi:hypothetical protein